MQSTPPYNGRFYERNLIRADRDPETYWAVIKTKAATTRR